MSDRDPIYLEPALTVLTILSEVAHPDEPIGSGRRPTAIGPGVRLAQQITGRDVSAIYKWLYPKDKGGRDGVVPRADAIKILAYAKQHRIKLHADVFFGHRAAV